MMKVSLILTAVDRITKPIREALRSIEALGAATTAVGAKVAETMGAATRTTTELEHATTGAARAERELAIETGKVGVAAEKIGLRGTRVIEEYGVGVQRAERATDGLAVGTEAAAIAVGRFGTHIDTILGVGRAAETVVAPMTAIGAKATASAAKVTAATGAMRRALAGVAAVGRGAGARVGGGVMGVYDFGRDAGAHFRTSVGEEGMARAARSAAYLKSQVSGLTGGLTLLKFASIGAGIGLAEEFVRGVFKAGGETQQMLVTLTRLEGSAAKARRSMAWMQTFGLGAGANFAMPDIMRSYQMAQNFGMNPQGGSLAAFADLAAGERVSMKQVLYAIKDAMEGTSTRPLANLGIKMKQGKKAGDPNSYLYSDASGRFVTETSVKSPEATLAKLVQIINAKYAGLATAQAKTVPGGIEQMKKLLYLFEARVAGAGVFDWALKQMNRLFVWVRRASSDGSLDRLAKQISGFMTGTGDKIIAFVRTTDWGAVGRDLMLLAAAIVAVARAVGTIAKLGGGGLSGLFNLWIVAKIFGVARALIGFRSVVGALVRMLWPFVLRLWPLLVTAFEAIGGAIAGLAVVIGAPVELVVAAIAGLAAVGLLLYTNWNRIPALFERVKKAINGWQPPAWLAMFGGVAQLATGNIAGGVTSIAGAVRPKPLKAGAPKMTPAMNAAADRLSRGPGALPRGQSTLTIDFKNPPSGMRVRSIAAHPGQTINVRRGPVGVGG